MNDTKNDSEFTLPQAIAAGAAFGAFGGIFLINDFLPWNFKNPGKLIAGTTIAGAAVLAAISIASKSGKGETYAMRCADTSWVKQEPKADPKWAEKEARKQSTTSPCDSTPNR